MTMLLRLFQQKLTETLRFPFMVARLVANARYLPGVSGPSSEHQTCTSTVATKLHSGLALTGRAL